MKTGDIAQIYRDGRHYDRLFGDPHLPFWLELARQTGGPILELGCGTGKITIPLAEAGFEVVGIDISENMLQEGRDKISNRNLPLRFLQADIALSERFNLIILPSNNLCHLQTTADAEACFRCVGDHLSNGGLFAIDVFVPNLGMLPRDSQAEEIMSEYDDPDGKGRVVVAVTSVYEADTQIRRNTTYQRAPGYPEVKGHLDMRMWFPQELEAVLRYNGFEIIKKYGNYAKEPFNKHSGKQLIISKYNQKPNMFVQPTP